MMPLRERQTLTHNTLTCQMKCHVWCCQTYFCLFCTLQPSPLFTRQLHQIICLSTELLLLLPDQENYSGYEKQHLLSLCKSHVIRSKSGEETTQLLSNKHAIVSRWLNVCVLCIRAIFDLYFYLHNILLNSKVNWLCFSHCIFIVSVKRENLKRILVPQTFLFPRELCGVKSLCDERKFSFGERSKKSSRSVICFSAQSNLLSK